MELNGKKLNFSVTKVGDIKKMQDGLAKYEEARQKVEALMAEGKVYEGASLLLETVKTFFIEVTGEDLLGDNDDLTFAVGLIQGFSQQASEQMTALKKYSKGL